MRYKRYSLYNSPGDPGENVDEGQLDINVCDIDVGRPIPNALVSISTSGRPEDVVEELTTDSSGQTPRITLPTPPIDYSLSPSEPKPFSEYDVRISMDGFEPVTVERVQIFPESTALQSICLHPADSFEISPEAIVIPDPVLWGQYPSKIPENPVKELPPSTGFVVLSKPVVPETIVVHSGAPSNASAQNYWVPFKDYIKNVASSEIYANWPEATLRANILAIISLTLNRVYTEWYRSKGYSFTITNSTAYDQAFTYGRNIFEEISVVVDDVFTTYITKPNIRQPLFSQYCDGKRTVCPNWMSQWGSKDLGDQGYSAIEILKKYYGNDVYLMQAEKVEGVPVSFPGTTLQVGSSGPNVRVVQEQINAIANNYPALKKLNVDGAYGESTKASVMKFQEIFKLPASGVVDFSTWYKLSAIYVAVTRMAEGV